VGTGPFKFVEWKQTDYLKVAKFDGYWRKGYPKVDTHHLASGGGQQLAQRHDADRRGATSPSRAARADRTAEGQANVEVTAAPSIVHRYLSLNTQQKAFRQPQGARGAQLRDQQGSAGQGGLLGLRDSGRRRGAEGRDSTRSSSGPWPYNPVKARELLKEAGYPNGFETTLWSAYNHTHGRRRSSSSCSSS
jgi:glutathione transport system substrate-binding protein